MSSNQSNLKSKIPLGWRLYPWSRVVPTGIVLGIYALLALPFIASFILGLVLFIPSVLYAIWLFPGEYQHQLDLQKASTPIVEESDRSYAASPTPVPRAQLVNPHPHHHHLAQQ